MKNINIKLFSLLLMVAILIPLALIGCDVSGQTSEVSSTSESTANNTSEQTTSVESMSEQSTNESTTENTSGQTTTEQTTIDETTTEESTTEEETAVQTTTEDTTTTTTTQISTDTEEETTDFPYPLLDDPSQEVIDGIKAAYFNKHNENLNYIYDYCGIYKGYTVFMIGDGSIIMPATWSYKLGDVEIGFGYLGMLLYAYKDGLIYDLREVYEQGHLMQEDVLAIQFYHNVYNWWYAQDKQW